MAKDTTDVRGSDRVTAVAGLVFAVLFVAGVLMSARTPSYDVSDEEWVAWFDDAGNRAIQATGFFLVVASVLSFLLFAVGLFERLRAPIRPAGDIAALVMLLAGVMFAVMSMVAAVALTAISAAVTFAPDDFPNPVADVSRSIEQVGFGALLGAGGWSAAVFVAAAAFAARRVMALPAWLTVAGYVAAVLLVFSVLFLPLVALPLWVIGAAIALWTARPTTGITGQQPASPTQTPDPG